jgi:hypothetical protein
VGARADLADYRDMLVTVRDKIAALKARGMSVAEVQKSSPRNPQPNTTPSGVSPSSPRIFSPAWFMPVSDLIL